MDGPADTVDDYIWALTTSRTLPDESPKPSLPPVTELGVNEWVGGSFDDIFEFIMANEDKIQKYRYVQPYLWLILDEKGLETSTCILASEKIHWDSHSDNSDAMNDMGANTFRAVRLPYRHIWEMGLNLETGNMNFMDYIDEDAGKQADGTYRCLKRMAE
jgi:hypothetical protein